MTSIELRVLKDVVYIALIRAKDTADSKAEALANDALEIIERMERIVEQLEVGEDSAYAFDERSVV